MGCRWRIPLLVAVLALALPAQAWKYSSYIDLAFPPSVKRSEPQSLSPDGPRLDCALTPLDPQQQRTPFPTTGGYLQVDRVNKTGELTHHWYMAQALIGQISGDDSNPMWRWVHNGQTSFENFTTGVQCIGSSRYNETGINATSLVSTALAEGHDGNGDVPGEVIPWRPELDIVGKNATIEFEVVLFDRDLLGSGNIEYFYYCAYVTFVTPEAFKKANIGGVCNGAGGTLPGDGTSPTAPGSPAGTLAPGEPGPSGLSPSGSPGFPLAGNPEGGHGKSHKAAIGAGVGASMGVALLLIIVGVILVRRRRKAGKTVPLDFFLGFGRGNTESKDVEGGGKGEKSEKGGVAGKGKGSATESESASIRSEQLPSYAQATEIKDVDAIEKVGVTTAEAADSSSTKEQRNEQ